VTERAGYLTRAGSRDPVCVRRAAMNREPAAFTAAAACPECGTVSGRVHETVLARPRDVRRTGDPVRGLTHERGQSQPDLG
jgi:hypothetical protein